jgi:hypothetical protein
MKYKVIISFLVAFLGAYGVLFAQPAQYTPMTAQGYQMKRIKADSTLHIPSFCGVPTIKGSTAIDGAIAIDTCGNILYKWTRAAGWSQITGGSGGPTDTTSLSNRINGKVDSIKRFADSVKYYKNGVAYFAFLDSVGGSTIDTTSLSNRINSKLAIVDTANHWVNSVTGLNDSTIRVIKGATTTDITIRSSATVTSATRLVTTVYNNTGATIPRGSIVYISGRHNSNLATVAPAQANNEANSYKTFALVADNITNNNTGLVIQAGSITGLNLPISSFTDGDIVYLSPTVAGGLTITKPLAPNHICKIGSITRAHPTDGSIEIKIENGWQLDELSDISIPAVPADSVILQFSRDDSLWHDVTITNAIGTRYIRPSDTTVFQPKQLRQYSFMANGTSVAANATATYYKDTSGTYTGSITWNGTAPSGATNHSYRWTRIGRMVNLSVTLIYATGSGTNNTQVLMTLPSDCPTPIDPTGLGAATDVLYSGAGHLSTALTTLSLAGRFGVRSNAADNGYELIAQFGSGAALRTCFINIVYYTNQ